MPVFTCKTAETTALQAELYCAVMCVQDKIAENGFNNLLSCPPYTAVYWLCVLFKSTKIARHKHTVCCQKKQHHT